MLARETGWRLKELMEFALDEFLFWWKKLSEILEKEASVFYETLQKDKQIE